jgi:hypothetical protein
MIMTVTGFEALKQRPLSSSSGVFETSEILSSEFALFCFANP